MEYEAVQAPTAWSSVGSIGVVTAVICAVRGSVAVEFCAWSYSAACTGALTRKPFRDDASKGMRGPRDKFFRYEGGIEPEYKLVVSTYPKLTQGPTS
jgi:hypothetical protein